MSRIGSGAIYVRPTNNIYTALAFISMASMLAAAVIVGMKLHELGAF